MKTRFLPLMILLLPVAAVANPVEWTVDVAGSDPEVGPTMHGIFFVDNDDAGDFFKNSTAISDAKGRVGVGTWQTQADFKDIVMSDGENILFRSKDGMESWDRKSGQWMENGGVWIQSANDKGVVILAGDPSWVDYTLSLKIRKTGGSARVGRGQVLKSASPDDRNTLAMPDKVATDELLVPVSGASIRCVLPAWSHTVLRVPH